MIIFRTRSDGALCRGSDGVRGATGGWMKNGCVCFLLWGIGWCISWYPVVFAACLSLRLPVCLSASPRGNDILHLPLDLHRSPSVCLSLAALLSLSSPPFISHFAPSCHSVICFYQHHFSLLSHPPSPFFSSLTHPPLFFFFFPGVSVRRCRLCSPHVAHRAPAVRVWAVCFVPTYSQC